MKKYLIAFLISLIAANFSYAGEKGNLVIIGGGKRTDKIMNKIIELSGGKSSKIVIIPMASSIPIEVGKSQVEDFKKLGAEDVSYIYCDKEGANADSNLAKLEGVTGIFFSGGDQNVLTSVLLNTKLLERIKEIYYNGGCISGTSAGAAVMSKIMITGDELKYTNPKNVFGTIEANNVKTSEGFGFMENVIVDQHFIFRKRHNRLISTILKNQDLLGIGIDESTSIVVYPNNLIEVIGDYQIILYDASEAVNIYTDNKGLYNAENIRMHVLTDGNKFDLNKKKIVK